MYYPSVLVGGILESMSVTCRFYLPCAGMHVAPEVLGQRIELELGGYECAVQFPENDEDFGCDPEIGEFAFGANKKKDGLLAWQAIHMIRIDVTMPQSSLRQSDLPFGRPHRDEHARQAKAMLKEGEEICRTLGAALFAWARADQGQHWIPPDEDGPHIMRSGQLFDESGKQLATVWGGTSRRIILYRGENCVGLDDLSDFAHRIEERPKVADLLFADAWHYGIGSRSRNPKMAILLSAMACELQVKETLRNVVSANQTELLNIILDNPREVTQAPTSLFDGTLKAVTGRSLREDDHDLWKRLCLLFQRRNHIAHQSVLKNQILAAEAIADGARESIKAARDAFSHLAEFSATS